MLWDNKKYQIGNNRTEDMRKVNTAFNDFL